MRAVVQRVSSSKVTVDGEVTGEINKGLLVLLGVTHEDTSKDVDYIIDKVLNLRIFEDENEKMNLSLKERKEGIVTKTGQFGAHMMVDLTNDGPVTILLESNRDF